MAISRKQSKTNFTKDIDNFSKKAGININIVAKSVAFSAFKSVVDKTPVDTGWARVSWRFSEGVADKTFPQKPTGSGIKDPIPNASAFNPIKFPKYYITNNLPYIKYLEAGTAKYKTPNTGHMIERTENILQSFIKDAVRKLK